MRLSPFFLLVALLCSSSVVAQIVEPNPVFKNFTADHGMPSNEVYHIIQDSVGYMWLATDNGISRYDGYTFKNYGIEDGLVETTIHEIYIDYKGRYWFISNSGRLAYMEDGVIKPYEFNFRINDYVAKSRGTIKKSFYVDSLNTVYLSLGSYGRITISQKGIVKEFKPRDYGARVLIEEVAKGVTTIAYSDNDISDLIMFERSDSIASLGASVLSTAKESPFYTFMLCHGHNRYTLSTMGHLLRFNGYELEHFRDMGSPIIWVSTDYDMNLWAASHEGGIEMYEHGEFWNRKKYTFLQEETITSVARDMEGGYWFSTLSNGIFYTPNISMPVYGKNQGLPSEYITSLFVDEEGIFIGNDQGSVLKIQDRESEAFRIEKVDQRNSPIRFITKYPNDNTLWLGSANHLLSIRDRGIRHYYLQKQGERPSYPRQMIPSMDGEFWVASSWGIRKFNGTEFTYNSREENEFSGMVYTVYQDKPDVLWIGTSNGIWQYRNSAFIYLGDKNPLFAQPANHITAFKNRILIGSKGLGLIVVENDTVYAITQKQGLPSNYVNQLAVDHNTVWLATKNGVSAVSFLESNTVRIRSIDVSKGLPTNEVNGIYVYGERVYAATAKGLCVFDRDQIVPHQFVESKTLISSVRINGEEYSQTNAPLTLQHSQNHLVFTYVGFNYRKMGKVNYQYRLLGVDSTWTSSSAVSAAFHGLNSGKYTFQVRAQGLDETWYSPAQFAFTIMPPFWKRIWFILLLAFVFNGILFFFYRLRVTSIRKRDMLVNTLNTYKLQSLRQQMNPHFIFNTLNSIQLYILEKDHISSHKYLTKFASLMRLILDNSQKSSVTLKDELNALRLYLELESVRLMNKLDYSIDVENDDLINLRVPSMLIQPFVENAIWHGIMLKPSREGTVKITFRSEMDKVICTIEDDGVGRKEAQAIRNKREIEHKSMGYKITGQRVQMLNTLYKDKFSIIYHDLVSSQGVPTGTRVEITIPVSFVEE